MAIQKDYLAATVFTLVLHVIVVAAVLAGWQMSDSARYRVPTPRYVTATLVTLEPSRARKAQAPAKPPPAAPVQVAAPKAAPPKAAPPKTIERKSSPKQAAPQPEVAIKTTTASTTAQPKPKPKSAAAPAPTASATAPASASASATAGEPAGEQARQQQDDLLRALAEEESLMAAEEDATAVANYAALIKQRVEGAWSRPPSARKNMQVVLSIRMIPTGDIIGVEVVDSSGNAAFDRSAVAAVQRVQRFPELSQMPGRVFDAYFRTFTLVFKPEDLLL